LEEEEKKISLLVELPNLLSWSTNTT